MKNDFDSYAYYFMGSRFIDRTIRYRVDLKDEIIPEKLKIAVQTYAKHHPWIKCYKGYVNIV